MPENDPPTPTGPPDPDPLDRLPHAGAARLPGRVVALTPSVRVVAERRLESADSCLNAGGFLPSMLMVELMAQVGGLLIEDASPSAGYAVLAGVRRMHLHAAARAGETVEVACELARRIGDLYLIECCARSAGRNLAHGAVQIRRVRKAPA